MLTLLRSAKAELGSLKTHSGNPITPLIGVWDCYHGHITTRKPIPVNTYSQK